MNCPHCGQLIKGVNHNERGWRCEMCWGWLGFDWKPEPEPKPVSTPEPAPTPKPAPKAPRPIKK